MPIDQEPPKYAPASPDPASRPVGSGLRWFSAGFDLFKAAPLQWIAMSLLFFALLIGLQYIPVIGQLASTVLSPVLVAGFLIAAAKVGVSQSVSIPDLFAGFSTRTSPLLLLGGLQLLLSMALFAVLGAAVGTMMEPLALDKSPDSVEDLLAGTAGTMSALGMTVVFLLAIVIQMGMWFAPALVVFAGQAPLVAFKTSILACFRNLLPMFILGLLLTVAAILASLPFFLGWLILFPVMLLIMYSSYADIFGAPHAVGSVAEGDSANRSGAIDQSGASRSTSTDQPSLESPERGTKSAQEDKDHVLKA